MKKIFALIITFLYLTTNMSFALSELYNLTNTTEQSATSIVKNSLQNLNYRLVKENPFYVISNKKDSDFAVIILQQNGSNVYYYYYSSDKNKELNKALLRTFNSFGLKYEQLYNTSVLNVYDNLAQRTMNSGNNNYYVFEDDAVYSNQNIPQQTYPNQVLPQQPNRNLVFTAGTQQQTNSGSFVNTNPQQSVYSNQVVPNQRTYSTVNTTVKSQQASLLKGSVVQIASGTKFPVYLQNPINTSSAQKGDRVVAVLTDGLKYNGITVIPQGSLVYGSLTKARPATYGSRNGRVVIEFTQLVTPENKVYQISTDKIDFTVTNDGKVAKTVSNTLAGAAVGALAGLLFAAMGDLSFGAAAAVGAGVGAGTSLVGAASERGVDAEIPSFTELELTLTKSFSASVSY